MFNKFAPQNNNKANLIEQQKDGSNEGYYKFTVKYMVGGIEYTQTFEFTVVDGYNVTNAVELGVLNNNHK